jgi:hypothetical protein
VGSKTCLFLILGIKKGSSTTLARGKICKKTEGGILSMKILGYSIFAIGLLIALIFVLQPDNSPRQVTREVEDIAETAPNPEETEPAVSAEEEQPLESEINDKPKREHVAAGKTVEDASTETQRDDRFNMLSETVDEDPFDMSEVPDFPPLPPLEDDDSPSFGELDLGIEGDEKASLPSWGKAPFGNESEDQSKTNEF